MKTMTIARLTDNSFSPITFKKEEYEVATIVSFNDRFRLVIEDEDGEFDEDAIDALGEEDQLLLDFFFAIREAEKTDHSFYAKLIKGDKIPFSWEDHYFIIL